ncbi:MAG: dialkylresorcinol condensing enzyme [Pseudomonadota bacterium]
MKRVLVIYYSQTDQLTRVVRSVCAPLEQDEGVALHYERLEPQQPYPFPWTFFRFLDAFPESVYLDPPPLKPLSLQGDEPFDLVILAYQVWFLSPSLPISAFLQSERGKQLLADRPVVTLIVCRNMWLMAQEKVKVLLHQAGARLLDNVALVDRGSSLATFITTPRWLLTGNKGREGGLLPPAGVAEQDIARASRFGRALAAGLAEDAERGEGPLLHGLGAVEVDVRLIPSEKIGTRSFMIWGKLLRKVGGPGSAARKPVLFIYVVFLVTLIITVVPVTMLLRTLLRPLMRKRLEAQKAYYELPSGSDTTRVSDYLHE